jgi:hypothetical protein
MFFRRVLVPFSNILLQPFGVSYSGATYKYTVLDTTGQRAAAAGGLATFVFVPWTYFPRQWHNSLKPPTNPF